MITGFENKHNMYCRETPMEVMTVPEGIILPRKDTEDGPMWGLGGVCDAQNNFVPLSAYDGGWATQGGFYPWEEEEYRDDEVVYFGVFFRHWGHFLVDLIGRMWYVARSGKRLKVACLGDEMPEGNFLECFRLLGLEQEDLICVTRPTRFRSVIVPEYACLSCVWYSREYRMIFDTMIQNALAESRIPEIRAEKIYFSRLDFGKARGSEVGETYIAQWLQANGFVCVGPEKLSVSEQIRVWNNARRIVCLDGSIPISVAFCANRELKLTVLHKTSLEHQNLELFLLMRPCDVTLLNAYWEPFRGYPKNIGAGPFLLDIGKDVLEYSRRSGMVMPFTRWRLRLIRVKNWLGLARRIWNIGGRLRLLASRLLPAGVKQWIRRLLGRGE